jgi:hypothetical protein
MRPTIHESGSGSARPRLTGVALVVTALALTAASAFEFSAGDARGDGDNPADSLRFLDQHGAAYSYSGLALLVGGVALVVSVLGMTGLIRRRRPALAADAASVFGLLGGGFLVVAGVMRLQAVGTVPHIASLDEAWGESAYLVVQIAGTQGLLSAGMLALCAWLVSTAIGWWRRRVVPPTFAAIFPLAIVFILLTDLALPFLVLPEWVFLTYVVAITLGLPLCCLAFGVTLLVSRVARERLAAVREPGYAEAATGGR